MIPPELPTEPAAEPRHGLRVGVIGARGRMGAQVCQAVESADDLVLAAGVDVGDDPDELVRQGVQVAVDFTVPDAAVANVRFCVEHGIHVVVGTSGFTAERLDEVRQILAGHGGVGVLVAPNFGIGAVLMMQFAQKAAAYFESVEIVELHHPDKVDAPSGTATQTARLVAEARAAAGRGAAPDATREEYRAARGTSVDGIPVHAVRLRGLIAHQEVLLGSVGEVLTIRHDSLDRASFMPGVLLAVRQVSGRRGLTVGIDDLL